MNLQFTRETCFELSTSVLVTGSPQVGSRPQCMYGKESTTASKEAEVDCLYEVFNASQENSESEWMIPFTALQESSANELTSSMSCSSLHLQLEDEHLYMEPISCTDANTPRTSAVHYSVEETDPTSRGVIIISTSITNTQSLVHCVVT